MHSLIGSLEKLLSNTEDADIFAHNCEMIQRIVLNSLLGEGRPELVDSIIQSIKQVSQIPTGQALCVEYSSSFNYLFTFLDRAYVAQYLSWTE